MDSHMKKKILLTAIIAASITACGGGSSSSSKAPNRIEAAQEVTAENISQALSVTNASPANVSAQQIPSDLGSIATSSAEAVVVTANSNFTTKLSVPGSFVPSDKKVAGYLIETSPGKFLFVPATAPATIQAASYSKRVLSSSDTSHTSKKSKRDTSDFKIFKSSETKAISLLAAEFNEGLTEINFEGWSNSDFTLSSSIENLKLRIFPLLVSKNVSEVLTIDDIDLADPSNWVGVQELLLSVEAVATAAIQISLTWDSETDVDLWVVDENDEKLYYASTISSTSLGWLDYDNTIAYGPENITFDYKMPLGDYKVYVHHDWGDEQANYKVTIAVGDEVSVLNGSLPACTTDNEDEITSGCLDLIHTISVDSELNNMLKTPVLLSQYQGVWQLPENSSVSGYIDISENSFDVYRTSTEVGCENYGEFTGLYFPAPFKIENGKLKVSNALLAADYFDSESYGEVSKFSYNLLNLELSTLPADCVGATYEEY